MEVPITTDVLQLVWGVIVGLITLAIVATAVYWKLINIAQQIVRLLKELLQETRDMSKANNEDHQKFLDMVTRIDERSKKN